MNTTIILAATATSTPPMFQSSGPFWGWMLTIGAVMLAAIFTPASCKGPLRIIMLVVVMAMLASKTVGIAGLILVIVGGAIALATCKK